MLYKKEWREYLCKSRVRAARRLPSSTLRFGLGERDRDMGGVRGVLPCLGLCSLLFNSCLRHSTSPAQWECFQRFCPSYILHLSLLPLPQPGANIYQRGTWLWMWQWKRTKMQEEWHDEPWIEGNSINKVSYMLESDHRVRILDSEFVSGFDWCYYWELLIRVEIIKWMQKYICFKFCFISILSVVGSVVSDILVVTEVPMVIFLISKTKG